MKAKVQYNDFVGSVAADISDHTNLNNFLAGKGIDTNRFHAVGVSFSSSYNGEPLISMICKDTNQEGKLIKLYFDDFTKVEFFNLFKRLKFIVIEPRYENEDIVKEITIEE